MGYMPTLMEEEVEEKTFCPGCSSKVDDDDEVCRSCGASLIGKSNAADSNKKATATGKTNLVIIVAACVAVAIVAALLYLLLA